MVFVFGANTRGRHGAGAAKYAVDNEGAIYGQGFGRQGNSFGIPTKDHDIISLPLSEVGYYVSCFILYATLHPEEEFKITQIGCGLAGFTAEQIAPLFVTAPRNCYFDTAWKEYLPEGTNFWGTK